MKTCAFVISSLALVCASSAQQRETVTKMLSPYAKLTAIDIGDCRWTAGFWADRLELCNRVMIPNLGRLIDDPDIIHAYDNFLVAAGLKEGEFRGWSFHDGDFYKYVEALAYAYALTKEILAQVSL